MTLDDIPHFFTRRPGGLAYGLPFASYQALRAINSHTLAEPTACEMLDRLTSPEPPMTESRALALAVGDATHKAILEPELFDSDNWQKTWQLSPTKGLCTVAALQALDADPSRRLITPEIVDTARRCRDAVWAHKEAANQLLKPGNCEVTGEVWDEEMQVMRKCRIDRLPSAAGHGIIDIKTTHTSLSPYAVRSSVYQFNYHAQAAFYLDTLAMIEGQRRGAYYLIFVTKSAPFICRVFELALATPDLSFIRRGEDLYKERLAMFVLAHEENKWGAYEDEGAILLTAEK